MKKQMNNIKKANIGKGLGNGLAFGVTSGIAVSFAREIIQAIEDAKLEKKRRDPKTDSNTVVLHVPKELEKPASARDDFDDAKANDGKEIELKTPERDKAGRFTPNWVSKQAGTAETAAAVGGGIVPSILGIEYLGGMAGGMKDTKEALKSWWNNYKDDTGTILGSTAGIVGGYIIARKLAQKLEEARLKREIAAAQEEYAKLLTAKKASCELLELGIEKSADEDDIYFEQPKIPDRSNDSSVANDIGTTIGKTLWEGAKSLIDPAKHDAAEKGKEHAPFVDKPTAAAVNASSKVFAGTTVATIIAALAIAHVTKKVLKQKYGNPNVKRDVVPRTTSVILKASEDNSFEISPATAIVTLGYIKEAMAYDMNKPILDGIKKAQALTPDEQKVRFMTPEQRAQAGISNVNGIQPATQQAQVATPQKNPGLLIDDENMWALATKYMSKPENFRAQLYRQFNPGKPLPQGYGEVGFADDAFNAFGVGQGELSEIKLPLDNPYIQKIINDNSSIPDGGFVPHVDKAGVSAAISAQLRSELESLKKTDPKRYDAFIGGILQTNPALIKELNSADFKDNVNAMADAAINNYFSPKGSGFGKAISSGWMASLPFWGWLRSLASWLFKNTRMGHALGLRSALGKYTKNPGALLMKAYENGPVANPNIDEPMEKDNEYHEKIAGLPGLEDITNINILGDASNTALDEKLDQLLGRLPGSRRETKRKYVSITGDKETQALIRKKRKQILKILQDLNAEYSEQ